MGSSVPQVFAGITEVRYAALVAKAQGAGLPVAGNSGVASKMGVKVSWSYEPDKQTLTMQVLGTPFFVNSDAVNAKIAEMVKETA